MTSSLTTQAPQPHPRCWQCERNFAPVLACERELAAHGLTCGHVGNRLPPIIIHVRSTTELNWPRARSQCQLVVRMRACAPQCYPTHTVCLQSTW
jgi:hypothetical protein